MISLEEKLSIPFQIHLTLELTISNCAIQGGPEK